LTLEETERIVDLQVAELASRLADRRLELVVSDAARETIARRGYDPVYGARPLRRFIQKELETRIGRGLIAGDILEGDIIQVDMKNDQIEVSHHRK